jgi:hypothetical protein
MNKKSILITLNILIVYYVFTSGLVFEAIKANASGKLDLPYSIGLSGKRTGLANIVTKDDLECITWLKDNRDKTLPVVTDYNTYCSLLPYISVYQDLNQGGRTGFLAPLPEEFINSIGTRKAVAKAQETYLARLVQQDYEKWATSDCYIFISTWNTQHKQYVEATGVGTKIVFDLPEFNYPIVHKCGDTIIYKKTKPKG